MVQEQEEQPARAPRGLPNVVAADRRIRTLLADADDGIRLGARAVLAADGRFEVVAAVATAQAAVAAVAERAPVLCLLDAHLPGGAIEAVPAILQLVPEATVVMLGADPEDAQLLPALRAGARGYLLRTMDPERLPAALCGALAGEAAVPRTMLGRVLEELQGRGERRLTLPGDRTVHLTERERQVLDLLRDGASTGEVAAALFLSPVTVRRHISSVLAKLRVPDRRSALLLLDGRSTA